MNNSSSIAEEVKQIYRRLDRKIQEHPALKDRCRACGKCCDFNAFEHHLYVTTPELIYFAEMIGKENMKETSTGRCPYNIESRCSIYEHRFAGCRIFFCRAGKNIQSRLTEDTLKKLKSLCRKYEIPYRYTGLAKALYYMKLNYTGRSAGEYYPGGRKG